MGLREQAAIDLIGIVEDVEQGFGFDCDITNPAGDTETFQVQSGDINMFLETGTDIPVKNRVAHVFIVISSLIEKGFDIPRPEMDESKNPWIFEFKDINENSRKFTVASADPDRTLGGVLVILELMKN